MKNHNNFSASFIGFLQAFGIFIYCSLIGFLLWTGNAFLGPANEFIGPALVLAVLVTSVLICALLAFGYPILLLWEKKETKEAISLVFYTASWLAFFILFVLIILIIL
ncbi:hypothetical protein ACFL0C_02290 [Patescibacteria group bacterium]